MLRYLRWWYCRLWSIGKYWLNLRDKTMHLLVMSNLQYNLLVLFDLLNWSYLWLLAVLFNAALGKEIYDYIHKTRYVKPKDASEIQIDSIWDLAYDLLGMLAGWYLFHNFRAYETMAPMLLTLIIANELNQVHFKPDGSQALWRDRHYYLDDFPVYAGKVKEKAALLDEWTIERMRLFEEHLNKMELGEEYDDDLDA